MRSSSLLSVLLFAPLTVAACGGAASETTGSGGAGGAGGSGASAGTGGNASGGATGGSTTTSTSSTQTGTGGAPAAPIDTPKETWTYVPFDNAFCANGVATGIGANITDKSSKVFIYLEGGGACWNELTCYTAKTAINIANGYGPTNFAEDQKGILKGGLFNRSDAKNPLKDASYFYIPYCTGDVHAGANPDAVYGGKPTKHVGFENMKAYLQRIVATFPNAERVLLSGSSAGGFGAGFNWWQAQQAFGNVRVDLLDDSGPSLPSPYLSQSLQGQWRSAWNLNATFPEGCAECQTEFSAIFGFYAQNLPKNRGALLSYTNDQVIASYFQITQAQVAEGLGVLSGKLDGDANFRYYFVSGNSHVLLGNPAGITQNGVVLQDWITQMLSDDPNWKSVKP